MEWVQVKEAVEAWTGLERDALHVYAAVGVHVIAALVSRRPLSHIFPWLCVLAVEIANESADLFIDPIIEQWEVEGAIHDLWNTMLIPTLLLLLTRFAPGVAVDVAVGRGHLSTEKPAAPAAPPAQAD
ncbi:MAG TPA: hypothetical protein VGB62_08415 [Allosphingosinicella sp.]